MVKATSLRNQGDIIRRTRKTITNHLRLVGKDFFRVSDRLNKNSLNRYKPTVVGAD
jgi:hypothetical protein